MIWVAAISLGIILFLLHFFSDALYIKKIEKRTHLKTFVAGISLTYIFLHLIPQALPSENNELFFAFFLVGFVIFNMFESMIYNIRSSKKRQRELKEEHATAFFLYNFLLGVSILFFLRQDLFIGIIFFIPVALHALISASALREMHTLVKQNQGYRILLSISTLLGMALALIFALPENVSRSVIGFVAGSLLYIIFRDLIPKVNNCRMNYFLSGIFVMLVLLAISWIL
ncbi:hypothetical protein HN592_04805 [Candidatus Woesearchaeota archaeon]|jgi:zinc transporter ZupT|nr:hypothetical protein [Candidatus Woesearchaeota archaeon]MBT4368533.1 hypothetical protein [Candidatus Woesearchaeota archaeon]MBT4713022.1 hypothetical protein [Candidatus Woesearchaeota archaeon]MBT6639934.1 hypothetical protein [Candidatus Woesearchaeota archaeon]MBT7134106.1 hypothetical protein [Candidatus Woesearchaeota archaeon]